MQAKKSRILYFAPELPLSQNKVIFSQVLAPASFLAKKDFDCMFIGTDVSNEHAAKAQRKINEQYGIPSVVMGCYSNKVTFLSHWLTVNRVFRRLKETIKTYNPTHIYTRSFLSAATARKFAKKYNCLHIHDVRGHAAEESLLISGKKIIRYQCLLIEELKEIRKADRLSCVSSELKNWIRQKTGRQDVVVIPSCADTNRFSFCQVSREKIRSSYRIGANEKIVAYTGGLDKWQRISDILRLFIKILRIDSAFKFLFVVKRPEQLKEIIQDVGLFLSACIITSCDYEQVPQYLSAADMGIIMRDNIFVNNVACPVKIAEYLACGLPVILTKGIGDLSTLIERAGTGVVIDDNEQAAQQIINFMQAPAFSQLRDKAAECCKKYLSYESHLEKYQQLFQC